jgi:hypothetical protein
MLDERISATARGHKGGAASVRHHKLEYEFQDGVSVEKQGGDRGCVTELYTSNLGRKFGNRASAESTSVYTRSF